MNSWHGAVRGTCAEARVTAGAGANKRDTEREMTVGAVPASGAHRRIHAGAQMCVDRRERPSVRPHGKMLTLLNP